MKIELIEMPKPSSALPDNQVKPDSSLEKRTRRKFTADYKLRIITEADACKHGEFGAVIVIRDGHGITSRFGALIWFLIGRSSIKKTQL